MQRLLLIVLPLLLIVGCSKPVEDSTLINKDGVMYLPNSDKPYTGEVFRLYDTGEKEYQGTYENGLLIEYSYLKKDGSVKEPINYEEILNERERSFYHGYPQVVSGVFYTKDTNKPYSGPVFSLDENGRNKIEGILEDGKMITHKKNFWYDNGQKKLEERFKDGEFDGLTTDWYENGQKKYEATYKDGGPYGLWTGWHQNGQKSFETTWKEELKSERLATYWHENGQKAFEGNYKDAELHGLLTRWYENGQKKSEEYYKDAERHGLFTRWDENGQKESEEYYIDGERDGTSTEWYENGQMKSEIYYEDGQRDGTSTEWYENGQKKSEYWYENGKWDEWDYTEWNEDGSVKKGGDVW